MTERQQGPGDGSEALYRSPRTGEVEQGRLSEEESRTKSEIREGLLDALSSALSYEYYRALKEADDILVRRYREGSISAEEFRQAREQYKVPPTGSLDLWNIREFALALECINFENEEARRETLGHEYSHYREARRLGLYAWFNIRFLKMADGRVARIYSVQLDLPKDLDEDARREIIEQIGLAPNNLSESDRRILGL